MAFKAPRFGTLNFPRGSTGRHHGDPRPLEMSRDDGGEYPAAHRREGRHGITPATQPHNRPTPTGAPAGQHRKGRAPEHVGRHRQPDSTWYPTKTDWRRLMAGETVNGVRLAR